MKVKKHLTNQQLLNLIAEYFKVLSEPLRIRILYSLKDGEKSVSEIVKDVNASQPNVSKHLHLLVRSGVVQRRQEKNMVFCSIVDNNIRQICDFSCHG